MKVLRARFFTQKKSARELKFPERFLQFEVFIFV